MFLHEMPFSSKLIYPMAMPWIGFSLAFVFFKIAQPILKLSQKTTGCLILVAGLGNTSFVGLPMITAYYGAEYVGIGILCDQPGSFFGPLDSRYYCGDSPLRRFSIRRSGSKEDHNLPPPFQAVILGLAFRAVPIPEWSIGMLKGLGLHSRLLPWFLLVISSNSLCLTD